MYVLLLCGWMDAADQQLDKKAMITKAICSHLLRERERDAVGNITYRLSSCQPANSSKDELLVEGSITTQLFNLTFDAVAFAAAAIS